MNSTDDHIDAINKIIDDVLHGIDIDSTWNDDGWWETSKGTDFGAERKATLKARIRAYLEQTPIT